MVTIRPAQHDDIAGIRDIAKRNLQLTATAIEDPEYIQRMMNRVYSEASLQRAVESTSSEMLVAIQDERVVGVCNFGAPLLDECEDMREIHRLLIHPDYTKQGIGTAFIDEIEQRIDEEACSQSITVYVSPTDMPRLHFYLTNGFEHEATEDKDGMWYMELML